MVNISVSDLTKTYGSSNPLMVTVTEDGSPVRGVPVNFSINGVDYERYTNREGVAMLNINLNIGAYECRVSYDGVTRKVLVRVIDKPPINLIVSNLTKTYGTDTQLVAKIDIPSIITGLPVQFNINGRSYDRLTDVNGEAHLNINLNPGVYPCTVVFPGNNTYKETKKEITVTVKANTLIDGFNITKSYSDKGFYQCAVYDAWQRLNPCTVELTINGVKYTRTSNDEGLIRLNINLIPGEYAINVKFPGDATHNPSSRADLVTVVPDIREMGSYTREGAYVPENNRGELKSHIYIYQADAETDKKNNNIVYYGVNGIATAYNGIDISYSNYEITETDPRVKTARFTTDKYFDLTKGRCFVQIVSPYHENFGGIILKVNYDKNTGLYTYQCQDGRRQYLSKRSLEANEGIVYDMLEICLAMPNYEYKDNPLSKFPITEEQRRTSAPLLSGLQPIENYDGLKAGALKYDNKFKEKINVISFDSIINKIMNLSHNGGFPTDVYFDSNLICHIDPIDLDYWLSHGIRLTHQDIVHYKYGFDTTNILTGVRAKNDGSQYNSYWDTEELAFYFGGQVGMIDAATTTTTTTNTDGASSNTVSTGIMSGKKTFDVGQDRGIASDYRLDLIKALREKGHTVNDLGVGPNVVQANGQRSSSKGHIGIFVCNGICCGTHEDLLQGLNSGNYNYDHMIITWVRGDIEMNKKQNYAWDWYYGDIGLDKSITRQEFFDKHADKLSDVNLWPNGDNSAPLSRSDWGKQVQALVNGQFNNGSNSAASSTGTSETQTTTVPDETATYQKALDEMSKSVRSLLSFEVKVPLNSSVFKNLHTNSMLWTQLPQEFRLGNLEKIFKILPSYKVNRGVSYMENRWYVEKIVIKQDYNGLFATITLNPFPSSYSSYSNAVKQYAEAYDQKFNKKTENRTTTSTGNRQPRLGNDSTDTNSMRAMGGGYFGNAGDNHNFDEAAKKGYAQQGRGYYDWARQYNTPIELAKALANRFSYSSYYNNHDANADVTHNNGGTIRANCYDACRLVKCCFDAAGFDAVVITGTIYQGGHGWNAVKHNGRWYSFDLCYAVGGLQWQGTNSLRLCDEW